MRPAAVKTKPGALSSRFCALLLSASRPVTISSGSENTTSPVYVLAIAAIRRSGSRSLKTSNKFACIKSRIFSAIAKWVNLQLTCVSQNCRSRASETFEPCTLPALAALPMPHERGRVLIPASHRLFQPVNDLLRTLRVLTRQGPAHQDALHRLRRIQPRAGKRRVERHDAMFEEPANDGVTVMACQIIPHQNHT